MNMNRPYEAILLGESMPLNWLHILASMRSVAWQLADHVFFRPSLIFLDQHPGVLRLNGQRGSACGIDHRTMVIVLSCGISPENSF